MSSKFEKFLPKKLCEHMPYEIEDSNVFGVIVETYRDLKRADELGMIKYTLCTEIEEGIEYAYMKVDSRNYDAKAKLLKKDFATLKPTMTDNAKLILPKHPSEIARNMYLVLSVYNLTNNTDTITVKVIKDTMRLIIGTMRLPEFTDKEKMNNILISTFTPAKK